MKLDAIVIGGGVTGLATGALLTKAGRKVAVLEKGNQMGGRAYCYEDKGFTLNYGPHAMYRPHTGLLTDLLKRLDRPSIDHHCLDPRRCYFDLDGRRGALGPMPQDLLTTGLFPFGSRMRLIALLTAVRFASPDKAGARTWRAWLEGRTRDPVGYMNNGWSTMYATFAEVVVPARGLTPLFKTELDADCFLEKDALLMTECLQSVSGNTNQGVASMKGKHLFTSEAVGIGHPDKVCDQISDAILDAYIAQDPHSRVACETLVTTGIVVVAGEITSKGHVEVADVARETIRQIGYTDSAMGFDYRSCGVVNLVHGQSPDISQGVSEGEGLHKEQGAGDQGIMFGYACTETEELMPLPITLAHRLMEQIHMLRDSGTLPYLRPDAKSQVTVEYDGDTPVRVDTVVVSTQHAPEATHEQITRDITEQLVRKVIPAEYLTDQLTIHVNPTGRFEIGGPHGDSGVTGRKIIVDTYGGKGSHGGGAFSGKDPSKVDRSGTYFARYIAKNIVAAGLASRCEVQLAYAIGVADPVSVLIDTSDSGKIDDDRIAHLVREHFDMRPRAMIETLNLLRPIYRETAKHGHFGHTGDSFTWERTDVADALKKAAGV